MKSLLNAAFGASLLVIALAIPRPVLAEVSDAALAQEVVQSIQHYSFFSMFDDVNISVDDRIVTLTGRVTRPSKKDEIGRRVAEIDGIRRVVNDIGVLPLSPADDQIRMRVARAIYNHPSFWQYASRPQPPIHIIVERGRVTLTGYVATQLDRTLAEALAQVPGAFSVTNDLQIDGH